MNRRCALRVFCTLVFCLIITTSLLASFLDEILVIPVEPSSTIIPPTTTMAAGSSTVSVHRITPSTTSITGSSSFSSTTIMPSTATISSVATELLIPTIETVSYSKQAVSPESSNIIPTAGTAKNMPDTNVASHLKTTITPIAGKSIVTSSKPTPTYVQGIDVSHWQGNINWFMVYAAGYRFAFVKASEGIGWADPNFVINMENGRNAGLLMGAYHFARPDLGNTAQDEALYFISIAGNYLKSGWLRPALDLEVGSALGKEAISKWVEEWMETVKKETGVEPIIYVNSDYASNYLDISLTKYNLWIAHWTYDISITPNTGIWSSWDFWQYSDKGSVPGISGTVDLNLFNGDANRLYNVFVSNRPPIAKFEIIPENPAVGEEVIFDASPSEDPDGSVVSYEWDFGDGDSSITDQPVTSHIYSNTGSFTVTLTITDDNGAASSVQKSITVKRFWSFVVITDIHIGYGITDFGEVGYEDDGNGQDYWLTMRLNNVVEKIKSLNADNAKDYYIRFVVVLGDIVDTAEESEFKKAKEILDRLNDAGIPYIPIFGNHEAWPYTELPQPFLGKVRVIASEASNPIGDQYFEKYFFKEENNKNIELIKKLFGNSWKKMPNPAGSEQYLQNYHFSYNGIKFICLDFVTREHWGRIPKEMGGVASYTPIGGVGSDAELHPLTLWWLNISLIKEERFPKEPTVIFSHHPIWFNIVEAFSYSEYEKICAVIRESRGSNVIANFAGHVHENKVSAKPWFTVITTEAVQESTNDIIRIVKVDAKTRNMDYSPLESVVWEGYSIPYEEYAGSTVAILQSPGELRVYDEQDRVTGWVNGTPRNNIPNSAIYENMIFLSNAQGPYKYEIKGISSGYYTLMIANFTRTGDSIATFTASNINITESSAHRYIVNWVSLSQGEEGVSVQVDSNGDGVFEYTFTSDSELTRDEYMAAIDDIPPTTTLEIGEPKYVDPLGNIYVSSSTQFTLTAEDNPGGTGVASTFYRIYGDTSDTGWIKYSEPFSLAGLSDGEYSIDYYSTDYAGNIEPTNTVTIVLKKPSPPVGGRIIDIFAEETYGGASHIAVAITTLIVVVTVTSLTIKHRKKTIKPPKQLIE